MNGSTPALVLVCASISLAATSKGQQAPDPFVCSAESFANQLSSELHSRITVARELSKEILYVDLAKDNPREKLNALAGVLHASVYKTSTGILITRSKADVKDIETRRRTARAEWISSALSGSEKYRVSVIGQDSQPDRLLRQMEVDFQAMEKQRADTQRGVELPTSVYCMRNLLPSMELAEEIVKRIGIDELAAIPTGSSVLYQSRPNPFARELPAIQDLIDNYQAKVAPLRTTALTSQQKERLTGYIDVEPLTRTDEQDITPWTVRFLVKAGASGIDVTLEIFNHAGHRIDSAHFMGSDRLSIGSGRSTIHALGAKGLESSIPLDNDKNNPINASIARNFNLDSPWLTDPSHNEPLAANVISVWEALSGENQGHTIMDLPDILLRLAGLSSEADSVNIAALEYQIEDEKIYDSVQTPYGFLYRPLDPLYVQSSRADRVEFGKLMKDTVGNRHLEMRELAKQYAEGYPNTWTWLHSWPKSVAAEIGDFQGTTNDPESVIALIGAPDDESWEELANGKVKTAAELNITQAVTNLVMSDDLTVSGAAIPDQMQHLSEVYGQSDVGQTRVSLVRQISPAVKVTVNGVESPLWGSMKAWLNGLFPIYDLSTLHLLESREAFEKRMDSWNQFKIATEERLTLRLGLPNQQTLDIPLPPTESEISNSMTYHDLPQEVRDEVWQHDLKAIASSKPIFGNQKQN